MVYVILTLVSLTQMSLFAVSEGMQGGKTLPSQNPIFLICGCRLMQVALHGGCTMVVSGVLSDVLLSNRHTGMFSAASVDNAADLAALTIAVSRSISPPAAVAAGSSLVGSSMAGSDTVSAGRSSATAADVIAMETTATRSTTTTAAIDYSPGESYHPGDTDRHRHSSSFQVDMLTRRHLHEQTVEHTETR